MKSGVHLTPPNHNHTKNFARWGYKGVLGLGLGFWFLGRRRDNPWNYRMPCFGWPFAFANLHLFDGLRCAENNEKRAQCKKLSINFCFHFVAKIRAYREQGIKTIAKITYA